MKRNLSQPVRFLVAGAAILTAMLLIIWFFMYVPVTNTTLALDWGGIRVGLENWDLTYGPDSALRFPPWSAILLIPLGSLPMRIGWGLVAFLTLTVLSLSLFGEENPGRKLLPGVLVLTLSYPALRTMVDGNVEFLILSGLLLMEYGLLQEKLILFAMGILLATTKVQETWILMLFLPLMTGKNWGVRTWLTTFGMLALVVLPTMLWKGRDWILSMMDIQHRGSIMDSSLLTTVQRLGGSAALAVLLWVAVFLLTIFIAWRNVRGYSRDALGFFTAVSLLLAPYAAGNNLLIVYAIGAIPLMLSRRWEGVMMTIFINLPFLFLPIREVQYRYSASYWTLVLLLAWILFALRLMTLRKKYDAREVKGESRCSKSVHTGVREFREPPRGTLQMRMDPVKKEDRTTDRRPFIA